MANSEISHLQMGQQWTQKYMDLAILGENEFKSEFFYFCLIQSSDLLASDYYSLEEAIKKWERLLQFRFPIEFVQETQSMFKLCLAYFIVKLFFVKEEKIEDAYLKMNL